MVAASGREARWPVLATAYWSLAPPIASAPRGHPRGRDRASRDRRRKLYGVLYPKRGMPKTTEPISGASREFKQSNPGV